MIGHMKKLMLGFLVWVVTITGAKANGAVARFKAANGQRIQVRLDGKVMNKLPKAAVKIIGKPGTREVTITVFNQRGKVQWIHKDRIAVKAGYICDYIVSFHSKHGTQLRKTGMDPLHVDRYRKPDKFYNKRNLAILRNQEGEGYAPVQRAFLIGRV